MNTDVFTIEAAATAAVVATAAVRTILKIATISRRQSSAVPRNTHTRTHHQIVVNRFENSSVRGDF